MKDTYAFWCHEYCIFKTRICRNFAQFDAVIYKILRIKVYFSDANKLFACRCLFNKVLLHPITVSNVSHTISENAIA